MICLLSTAFAKADADSSQTDNTAKEEDGYPADIMDQSSDTPQNKAGSNIDQSEPRRSGSGSEEDDEDSSDIDKDIESELSAMDSTLSADDKSKATTQVELEPPVQVDWSDVGQATTQQQKSYKLGKGSLKLQKETKDAKGMGSSGKVLTSPPPKTASKIVGCDQQAGREDWNEDSWNDDDDWDTSTKSSTSSSKLRRKSSDKSSSSAAGKGEWNDDQWEDLDTSTTGPKSPKSPKSPGKQVSNHKLASGKRDAKAPPKVQDFDLMAMDIKTSKSVVESAEEFDFFADMKPELKPQGDSLLSILKGDIRDVKTVPGADSKVKGQENEKKSAISFAVKDTTEVSASCMILSFQ